MITPSKPFLRVMKTEGDRAYVLSSSCLSVRRSPLAGPNVAEPSAENSIPGLRGTALASGRTVALLFVTFARYHGGCTQGAYHLYMGQARSSGIYPR